MFRRKYKVTMTRVVKHYKDGRMKQANDSFIIEGRKLKNATLYPQKQKKGKEWFITIKKEGRNGRKKPQQETNPN